MIWILVVLLLLFAVLPSWPYSRWGYGPSGILFIFLIVLLILALTGRI